MIEPPKIDIEKLRAKCADEWSADEPIKWYNDAEGYSHEESQGYYRIVDEDTGKEMFGKVLA